MSEDYNTAVRHDVFSLLCNREIGKGIARTVYTTEMLPGYVIKTEGVGSSFQNVIEWETWNRVMHCPNIAKWFAPCKWISSSGAVLVMERTHPIPPKRFPRKMPAFLTNFKRTNYGIYKNRVVCHDYGTSMLMEIGMTSRMKVIEWWGDSE